VAHLLDEPGSAAELAGLPAEQIRGRPEQAAEEALARLRASADRFLLHLDVDVVDFLDLPITEVNPDHGAEDGSTTNTLVRGLVDALAG
jgi:arginase family enzyme